jgi:hypothetical protein
MKYIGAANTPACGLDGRPTPPNPRTPPPCLTAGSMKYIGAAYTPSATQDAKYLTK